VYVTNKVLEILTACTRVAGGAGHLRFPAVGRGRRRARRERAQAEGGRRGDGRLHQPGRLGAGAGVREENAAGVQVSSTP